MKGGERWEKGERKRMIETRELSERERQREARGGECGKR